MIEILLGLGVCIPFDLRELIFNMATGRKGLARRLPRAFYKETDLIRSGYLNQLSDVIIPVIIGKMFH